MIARPALRPALGSRTPTSANRVTSHAAGISLACVTHFPLLLLLLLLSPRHATAQAPEAVNAEVVQRWMEELSNAGRWGSEDQLGTLNLITPEVKAAAAALVRDGISVSLSHDYIKEQAEDATSPLSHEMLGSQGAFLAVVIGDGSGRFRTGGSDLVMDAIAHGMVGQGSRV